MSSPPIIVCCNCNRLVKPISDLNALFDGGFTTEYDGFVEGIQAVRTSIHELGELILTSGTIVPCDPLMCPDTRYHLTKTLRPGRYPIIASLAKFSPSGDARFAAVMLKVSDAPTIRWEIAEINEPDQTSNRNARFTYGVDAGTGCFVDQDAAEVISNLVSLEVKYPNKDDFELFCDRVIGEMDRNAFGKYRVAGWADLKVSDNTEANIICFSSGFGDGGYASFWGYDYLGNLTSLATDFALFDPIENEVAEN